jgi:hypothetical protein
MTAATKLIADDAQLATGKVRLAEAHAFTVTIEGRSKLDVTARRAASCLLTPEPGDRVLVVLLADPYILAVLDRDDTQPARLRFDGDVRLDSAGELELGAARGVLLRTPRVLALLAGKLRAETPAAEIVVDCLTAVGRRAQAHFEGLGVVAQTCDLVLDRLASHLKRAYRSVEEYDQLRARHIDYRAEQVAQLKGETTLVTASQVAKIDGAQVHIG